MKLLVCGSRNWDDKESVYAQIKEQNPDSIITGDANGADAFARQFADSYEVPIYVFAAVWSVYGKSAGPRRNQQMVDQKPDLCLAFVTPDSKGTWDTVNRCKKAGIPVKIVRG